MGTFYLSENHQRPKQELTFINNDPENTFQFPYADASMQEFISRIEYKPYSRKNRNSHALSDYLDQETKTTAFLVIRDDTILYEAYYEGYDENALLPSWSVAKSFVGALSGIAIEEGFLSTSDPVTDYFPEWAQWDPNWSQLKVEHLLNMRSGIDFDEENYVNPYSDIADLYMSKNVMELLEEVRFKHTPGTLHYYSSLDTEILTLILERATGMSLSQYLEEKIFTPLGMESHGTWTLDSKKANNTKGFCCLNLTARDYAKLARLYLHGGTWNGVQIIDATWVDKSTTPDFENNCYQNQWYSNVSWKFKENSLGRYAAYQDSLSAQKDITDAKHQKVMRSGHQKNEWMIKNCGPAFYALGIFGQEVYVDPEDEMIFIRLGKKWDTSSPTIFKLIQRELRRQRR